MILKGFQPNGGDQRWERACPLLRAHRILNKDRSTLGDSWDVNYWVRVDQYLTETEMEMVVCAVLARERPDDYRRLQINFNYRLESFNFVDTDEYNHSWIGRYAWKGPASVRIEERGGHRRTSAVF